ncbi:MAG TPA: hypothetical protein VM238_03100 [Phycisphaerae bacterium]|nr:hypothetical protein [Phycisphaerae bacterium]
MAFRFHQKMPDGRQAQIVVGKLDADRAIRFGAWTVSWERGKMHLRYGDGSNRLIVAPIDGERACFEATAVGDVLAEMAGKPLVITGQGDYEQGIAVADEQALDIQDQAAGLRRVMAGIAR